jgi:hypothetical protein
LIAPVKTPHGTLSSRSPSWISLPLPLESDA